MVNGGVTELAQQGFLEVRPRQGTFVADYRRKGNLRTLIAIMEYAGGVLGNDEVRSILEVRRALEHLAVQRAIAQASDESMARLGEIVQALGQAQTHAEAAETAFLFQHELALASGNSILPLFYYSFKAPGDHPLDALLPALRHRRPIQQHPNPLRVSCPAGWGRGGPVDRHLSGKGHQRRPADLQRPGPCRPGRGALGPAGVAPFPPQTQAPPPAGSGDGVFGYRKAGFRRDCKGSTAPLRLRRGRGAVEGNPCCPRLFADLPHTSRGPSLVPSEQVTLRRQIPSAPSEPRKPRGAGGRKGEAEAPCARARREGPQAEPAGPLGTPLQPRSYPISPQASTRPT